MSNVVVCSIPMHGHASPMLAVVRELVARGESVHYWLTPAFQSAVESTGATFHSYETIFNSAALSSTDTSANFSAMPALVAEECLRVLPQVLEAVRAIRPDYLITDLFSLWGRIVAQLCKLPIISVRATYASNAHVGMFARSFQSMRPDPAVMSRFMIAMAKLSATYRVPAFDLWSVFQHTEPLNIVCLPRAFQPAGDTFDKRFVFVGPCLWAQSGDPDFPSDRLGQRPMLYISLGTLFNNWPAFFEMCKQAFGGTEWQVVLALGSRTDRATLDSFPANFVVASYVPQLNVLPHADVFVSHSGMTSTMDALYYGVPMVAIPQMPEQAMTAARIAELELGIVLEKDMVTVQTLQAAVMRASVDLSIRSHVKQMQQLVWEAGGTARAADAILEFRAHADGA